MNFYIINILTIYFASKVNLLNENITGTSLLPQYHYLIIIYTIFCACAYGYEVSILYKKMHIPLYTVLITTLVMSSSILSPYTIKSHDFFSTYHILASSGACISFILHLYFISHQLSFYNYQNSIWIRQALLTLVTLLITILFSFGCVNGLLEIVYNLGMCFILYKIKKMVL